MSVEPLKQLTDLVGAAADSVVKLTDGIKYCVSSGLAGYKYVSAKRDRNRLKEISARASDLGYGTQMIVARSIDDYLKKANPEAADWDAIGDAIRDVLRKITDLLTDVKQERSDFILEDAYKKLIQTMYSRADVLGAMLRIPPPSTTEEKRELQKLNKEYKRLLANFGKAIDELNRYLKDEQSKA